MARLTAIVLDANGALLDRASPDPHAPPPGVAGGLVAAAERIAREDG